MLLGPYIDVGTLKLSLGPDIDASIFPGRSVTALICQPQSYKELSRVYRHQDALAAAGAVPQLLVVQRG